MKRICAAIAIAAPAIFVTATVADASILFFIPKPNKPGQFILDHSQTPTTVITTVTKRQSGGTSSGLPNYNIVLGDSFVFQEVVTTAVPAPLVPEIPIIPKPDIPTKVEPPVEFLPPMNDDPEEDLPPVVEEKDPEIPVVEGDEEPDDPPVVEVTELAEPGTLGLLGLALAGLGMIGYRRSAA